MTMTTDGGPPQDTARQQQLRAAARERCEDPRGYFARLRAQGPLDTTDTGEGHVQVLVRADVERVLRDTDTFSNVMSIMGSEEAVIPLAVDPPKHGEYRRLLDPLFSRRRMAELEPTVAAAVNATIDTFVDAGGCDFAAQVAVPLPCSTFLALLGLPAEDLHDMVRWKDIMIRPEVVAGGVEAGQQLQMETVGLIYERFAREIEDRRSRPREDLMTYLTTAQVDGDPLTDGEIHRTLFLLLAAGLDTVTVSLECILAFLVANPEARQMLVREPETMDGAIEELLRWETPVQSASARRATKDTELSGCPIAAGTLLSPSLAAANLEPDGSGRAQVDLRRGDRRHLSFGGGPHRCLGSHLARMELRTVVREWHRRIPDYRLEPGVTLEWNGTALRGIDHLPLVWDVGTAS